MNAEQVRELLRSECLTHGQNAVARKFGISSGYMSEVLSGRQLPGPSILVGLGLVAVTTYERKP